MTHSFLIESWKQKTITQLPDGWSVEDYHALLDLLEINDVPPTELKDYVLLGLGDLERPEAAKLVLTYLLADALNEGQIQNIAHELEEEKLWEEYADINLHKYFFQATELLYEAFNGGFPHPKAEAISLILKPIHPTSAEDVKDLSAVSTLRLLSAGFDESSLLMRLFEEELKNGEFADAAGIIWHQTVKMITPDTFELTVVSSEYWFEDFAAPESFPAKFTVDQEATA